MDSPDVLTKAFTDDFEKEIMKRMNDREATYYGPTGEVIKEPGRHETLFFGDPKFGPLRHQLMRAYKMVAEGKGQQRHGAGRAWDDQPIMEISRTVGAGFPIGQAMKKLEESTRMVDEAAVNELLGAIGYIAAAIQTIEEGKR